MDLNWKVHLWELLVRYRDSKAKALFPSFFSVKEILVIISRIFLTDIYDERIEFDQLTGIAISSSAVTWRNLLIMNFMDFISDGNEYLHCLCWRGLGVAPAHNLQHMGRIEFVLVYSPFSDISIYSPASIPKLWDHSTWHQCNDMMSKSRIMLFWVLVSIYRMK